VSLEDAFWDAFRDIAQSRNRAVNDLAAEIDAMRGTDCGLASAIRLFVLEQSRRS
jgi:predicted DNA-binding ribbon-helix-helix protein